MTGNARAGTNDSKRFAFALDSDTIWLSREAMNFAKEIGFSNSEQAQIAIAVSELATNAIKFAGKGTLTLVRLKPPNEGARLVVEDNGPGIKEPDKAVIDGYSEGEFINPDDFKKRRGLGSGLGAVIRMMDNLKIENKPEGGVRATADKKLKPK